MPSMSCDQDIYLSKSGSIRDINEHHTSINLFFFWNLRMQHYVFATASGECVGFNVVSNLLEIDKL